MLSSKQRVGNERNELCASFSTRISRSSHALGHQRERERLFWEQSDHFITRKSGENLSSLKGLKDHSSTRVSTPRVCTRNLESLLRLDSPCQPVRSSNYIRFNYVCFTGPQAPFRPRRKTTDSKRIGVLTAVSRAIMRSAFEWSLEERVFMLTCVLKLVRDRIKFVRNRLFANCSWYKVKKGCALVYEYIFMNSFCSFIKIFANTWYLLIKFSLLVRFFWATWKHNT